MKMKLENLVLVLLISVWAYFSFNNWIGSSEFWPVTLAGHWDQWRRAPSLVYKPIFHLILTPLYILNLDSATHLQAAKALFTLIGATSFALIFKILRSRQSLWVSGWIFCILLFSQLGFTQFGKIRSDMLSLFFFLLGYWVLIVREDKGWKVNLTFFIFFELLILLTTPKAFLLALALAMSCWQAKRISVRQLLWSHLSLTLMGLILLMTLAFVVEGSTVVAHFFSWLQIGQNSLGQVSENLSNSKLVHWEINLPVFIAFVLNVVFISKGKVDFSDRILQGTVLFLSLLTLLLIHPLQPFFIATLLSAMFILFLGPQLEKYLFVFPILFFITFILFGLNFRKVYFFKNELQLLAIERIERELSHLKPVRVLDGLGLAPRIQNTLNYVGPNDLVSVEWAEKELMQNRPEFVIFTSRISLLSSESINYLQINYRAVGPGYWIRSDIQETIDLKDLPPAIFLFTLEPTNLIKI